MRSSKTIFTTSLLAEAQPLIERYDLKIIAKKPFKIYQNGSISLIVSGIGKINSAIATTFLAKESENPPLIVNIGICSSTDISKLHKFYSIKSVIDFATSKKFMIESSGESLVTVDKAVSKKELHLPCSLIDMEASGFLLSAKIFTSIENIKIFKIVSDCLDDSIPSKEFVYNLIKENISNIEDQL